MSLAERIHFLPNFGNIFYNGILHIAMPDNAFLIRYADNIATVIVA